MEENNKNLTKKELFAQKLSETKPAEESVLFRKPVEEAPKKKKERASKPAEEVQDRIKAFAVNKAEEDILNLELQKSDKKKLSEFIRYKVFCNFSCNVSDEDLTELINLSKDSKVIRKMLTDNKIYY